MTRTEVAMILGRLRKGGALIVGPGLGGRLIAAQGDEPLTVYNMEMAYVTSTALGVALGWPAVKVVAVEGDGSMLMGQAALTCVARYQPPNLIILVFDNGCYLTTGSGTATTARQLALTSRRSALARASSGQRPYLNRVRRGPPWSARSRTRPMADRCQDRRFGPGTCGRFRAASHRLLRSRASAFGAPRWLAARHRA